MIIEFLQGVIEASLELHKKLEKGQKFKECDTAFNKLTLEPMKGEDKEDRYWF